MIARLLSPLTASTRFSANQLPEAAQGTALWKVITPLVSSESMTPTLQIGDELELEQPDNLQVGDVVVYREDRQFICHRIHRIEGQRLFLRGDATLSSFEEVDIRQAIGRVEHLLRNKQRIALCPSTGPQSGPSLWVRASIWGLGPGRALALRIMNSLASVPGIERIVRHILRACMTIEMMERAPLHALEGYVARQQIRLDRLAYCRQYLSSVKSADIMLIVRAGPLYLGTCTLNPWHISMRPLLQRLTTAVLSESVDLLSPTRTPLHTTQRPPIHGKQ
ncbi:MAG: S24/S26 family peptidase [Nitrospiraceae bacterium]